MEQRVPSEPRRILIIDDEPLVCETLSQYLRMTGCHTEGFTDPREALEKLKVSKFQLAVVDLKMPFMNGVDFMKAARQISPELRFLIYTSSLAEFQLEDIHNLEISRLPILRKPLLDLKIMVEAIRGCFDNEGTCLD